jgi:hypothetical protein
MNPHSRFQMAILETYQNPFKTRLFCLELLPGFQVELRIEDAVELCGRGEREEVALVIMTRTAAI